MKLHPQYVRLFTRSGYAAMFGATLLAVTVLPSPAHATFSYVDNVILSGSDALNVGDSNGDGFLDVLESMRPRSIYTTIIQLGSAGLTFTPTALDAALSNPEGAPPVWADYDHDGDLDLAIYKELFRNDGNQTYTQISLPALGFNTYARAWADIDNDGDLDIVSSSVAWLENHSSEGLADTFTMVGQPVESQYTPYTVLLADIDSDGDIDMLEQFNPISFIPSRLAINLGDGTFSYAGGILGYAQFSDKSADYDGDGDLDFILSGRLFENNGPGGFVATGFETGGIVHQWGDIDNDGDTDIIALIDSKLAAFENINNNFAPVAVPNPVANTFVLGDYDNDLDLDIFTNSSDYTTGSLFRNDNQQNQAPSAPAGLVATWNLDGTVTFAWGISSDDRTLSTGLRYNLRVGTTPGGSEVLNAMANPATGLLQTPEVESRFLLKTSHTLRGLSNEQTYYWSVQAIDASFAGSAFAPEAALQALPHPDLALSLSKAPKVKVNKKTGEGKLQWKLFVSNIGTVGSDPELVRFYRSDDQILDDSDLFISEAVVKPMKAPKPGKAPKRKTVKVKALVGTQTSGYVLAEVVPGGTEGNDSNNVLGLPYAP